MRGRTFVWIVWLLTTILSACYGVLCLYTFINMTKLKQRGYQQSEGMANRWGLFAATMLSFVSVAFYIIFTMLVLARKSFHARADTGYGIIIASSLQTAMILLMAALVIHASQTRAKYWQKSKWFTDLDYMAYWGTFCLGYILTFVYVLNFLTLLFFKQAVDYNPQAAVETRPYGSGKQSAYAHEDHHDVELPASDHASKVDSLPTTVAVDDVSGDVPAKESRGFFKGAWK